MPSSAYEVVRQYVDLNRAGNHDAAMDLVSSDVQVEVPPSVPWGGSSRGRTEYDKRGPEAAKYFKMEPGGNVKVLDCGDVALLTFDGSATATATGRSFVHKLRELFTVEGGIIIKIEIFYWDTAMILHALEEESV